MSDVDDQGSLPTYVEHASGRSPRAKDAPPDPAPDEQELAGGEEQDDARARGVEPATRTPFEPSTGATSEPPESDNP
ncbi:hypothetical protein IF188_01085 [Microbacterium sp. NEAU-LLC]|uniref:Multidrug transporter n=1 Tax=Microbacterium helvum TaxID=2773713 RepID=A0ABR8NHW5_9MICO|nr:hypothetical protein [Microbacterium helvum]MBD3940293.1 hypothetical protein [Microbacterium helvum]